MFKDHADPVGSVVGVPEIELKLQQYIQIWIDSNSNTKSFWVQKPNLSKVTNFLLLAIDDFVSILIKVSIPGPDKKATVLEAVNRLYDFTVKEALPFWLKPFASVIKNYIIYVLISNSIDWIVAKYQTNKWKPIETSALERIFKKANVCSCKLNNQFCKLKGVTNEKK
jgi:F0F1-type ATP synthase membrane subunit a